MKKHYKYMLDTVMTVIMLLLMKITFVGLLWHEILGLGIFFLFIIHNIINFKYLKSILKKFSSKNIKLKIKIGISLDILLSIVVTGIVITGIMISKEIFSFGSTGTVSNVHHSLSYLSLILISIHVGLHWMEIMGAFRKLFRLKKPNKARTYFLRVVTLFIVFFGIKGSFNQDVAGKLLEFRDSDDSIDVSDIRTEGYDSSESVDDNNKVNANEVLTDFLPLMGMYIAGTYYLVMIPKYLKDRE